MPTFSLHPQRKQNSSALVSPINRDGDFCFQADKRRLLSSQGKGDVEFVSLVALSCLVFAAEIETDRGPAFREKPLMASLTTPAYMKGELPATTATASGQ